MSLSTYVAAVALASSLCLVADVARADTPRNTTAGSKTSSNTTPSNTNNNAAGDSSGRAIEGERKQAEAKAQSSVDREATAVVRETQNALIALSKKDKQEAVAALERATGKVNILLARNEKAALVPVDYVVEVADTAPVDPKAIKQIADAAEEAVRAKRFNEARLLLDALRSEIRVRTFTLPLASYPAALTRAAKLMSQGKSDDATAVLRKALSTLVVVDMATPLSLPVMAESIRLADEKARNKNITEASKDLGVAMVALRRSEALGQLDEKTARDLQSQLADLERKVKRNEAATADFARLRSSVTSMAEKHPQTASRAARRR